MFKLIQNTPVGGDCTCGYDVKLDREYTIEEFINTVLKNYANEWGIFEVKRGSNTIDSFEYSYGKLASESNNVYQDYKIKEVYASGGWSRMDYVLYLEEEKNLKPDKPNNNKESIVVIFKNETDETYSFVNLTRERICSSRFKTIEEAIHDLNDQVRNGLIESYTVKGNHPELSMDEIAQIIKK